MAYRRDLFEKAGLQEPPRTWDEFKVCAEKLNDPDSGIYGVVTMPGEQDGGYSEWTVRLASQSMPPNSTQFVWDRNFEPMLLNEGSGKKAMVPLTSGLAEYVEMQRTVYEQLFAAWVGHIDAETAINRANDGLNELMKSLGYQK